MHSFEFNEKVKKLGSESDGDDPLREWYSDCLFIARYLSYTYDIITDLQTVAMFWSWYSDQLFAGWLIVDYEGIVHALKCLEKGELTL